ncbi:hypothetical protein D5S17_20110 [Pseudonocardiaceae bacterium YIM PH 21723]|nr:hypothetical protein D5S17_20110 [Pseudonocardiaceae bacterium YIM PH 21723]
MRLSTKAYYVASATVVAMLAGASAASASGLPVGGLPVGNAAGAADTLAGLTHSAGVVTQTAQGQAGGALGLLGLLGSLTGGGLPGLG